MEDGRMVGASEARIVFSELLSRVAYGRERVVIGRRGRPMAAMIGTDELRLFERLLEEREDRLDTKAADRALADKGAEIVAFARTT
ncbi:MAG: type II toxin-antitoxin system Phd/YefM family antitoxin [Actinomycetota bacterium]|nr:type II toxin-antitoxin system Phd/YefM family antitoxin [Actinomycetota bacterium]